MCSRASIVLPECMPELQVITTWGKLEYFEIVVNRQPANLPSITYDVEVLGVNTLT